MKTIKLNKGQYLQEVEPFKSSGIPANCILYKTVTGCGITTSEMVHTKRNSIIILPNVPVIEGKVKKHNKECQASERVLGIYKGVETSKIEAYLSSEATYKKILTTPEGFDTKLLAVFKERLPELYSEYFLLFDECDRLVKDVDYRERIAAPVEQFFQFSNKAMVSATVLEFSDPRFETFDQYAIEPQFDFRKTVNLIETNNVLQSLRKFVSERRDTPISIFVNSTQTILGIIRGLAIEQHSRVFCAQDSVSKLAEQNFHRAQAHFNTKDLAKYNFFTSRFFSAVDIVTDVKHHVVLVTDITFADRTLLDPYTDTVQIAGRFRNGISSLTHVSNFNPKLPHKTIVQAKSYLEGSFDSYEGMLKMYHAETNPDRKEGMLSNMTEAFAHKFYNGKTRNPFMVDNYIHDETVKAYYTGFPNLLQAYKALPDQFATVHNQEVYPIGELDKLKIERLSGKELFEVVIDQMYKCTPRLDNIVFGFESHLSFLRNKHPIWAKGLDVLGLEKLKEVGHKKTDINKGIRLHAEGEKVLQMAPEVYEQFKGIEEIQSSQVQAVLEPLFKKFGVVRKVTQSDIKTFYDVSRTTKSGVHTFKLKAKKL